MGRRIELPSLPAGQPQEQLQALYNYLYKMAEALNSNFSEIGSNEFTDQEMMIVREVVGTDETGGTNWSEAETLKSLIIKTAQFIKSEIDEYNMKLVGTYEADGKLGKYVRKTRLDVDVTPTGIQQNYTFQEIIQGLKTYEVNAKNYIKTGLLRTVGLTPVYGVAIGKDVVTFSEDGTETYNDGNKVAELTADELSFWQNGNKVASYTGTSITLYSGTSKRITIDGDGIKFYKGSTTLAEMLGTALKFYYNGTLRTQMDTDGVKIYDGSTLLTKIAANRIGFYYNGSEVFYISSGKLYAANDMEVSSGKKVKIQNWEFDQTGLCFTDSSSNIFRISDETTASTLSKMAALLYKTTTNGGKIALYIKKSDGTSYGQLNFETSSTQLVYLYAQGTRFAVLGTKDNPFATSYLQTIAGRAYSISDVNVGAELIFNLSDYDANNVNPNSGQYLSIQSLWSNTDKRVSVLASGPIYFTPDLYVGNLYYNNLYQRSSREIKHDIQDLAPQGERLDRLRPVTFVYDEDPDERKRTGLIYEDTEEIMPEICTGDESGKAINYTELIPMLLKEIQELRARVKALEEREE